jgi:hypothetical protein
MSTGIQKSADFDGFIVGMDFDGLFNSKYT